MLHDTLDFLIKAAWVLLPLGLALGFWYALRRRGLGAALRLITSYKLLTPLGLLLMLTLLKLSLVFILPEQVGVVVSLISAGGIRPQALESGLHFVVPLAETVVRYPISWQTYTMSNTPLEGERIGSDAIVVRTKDSQEVKIDISIIFHIDPARVVPLHIDWQDRYAEELLRPATRSLVRSQAAHFTVDEVNSVKRTELEALLDAKLKEIARENGLVVKEVLIRNIDFSADYARAVETKQVALQGETQKQYEARQIEKLAQGQANKIGIISKAEAEAIAIKAEAQARARLIQAQAEAEALKLVSSALEGKQALLTYRYIEKLSPGVKAVVLPHDMPLIFPVPDLVPPAGAPATGAVRP
ncbi:MAG: prohibitin family protein [Gammaproteobacteria bacterium]